MARTAEDCALLFFVFEHATTDQVVDLFALLRSGISHYLDTNDHSNAIVHEPGNDLDAEEVTQLCINSGIKTKTMAKLLFTQGEYAQALRLYDELIAVVCADPTERAELRSACGHMFGMHPGRTMRLNQAKVRSFIMF